MRQRGFTLLEVMIGLALLGLALTVLIKSAAGSIFNAEQAHMMGIATDLARGKMYDIEETLLKDGFTDTDQSSSDAKPFEVEGWPNIYYAYKVEQIEMPDWDQLQAMAQGHAKNMGSAVGSGSAYGATWGSAIGSGLGDGSANQVSGFQNSMLGGMLGMMGGGMGGGSGGGGGDILGAQGGALIQMQYQLFQQILKVSIRKVTLTVTWKVLGTDRDMKVVAFFTDPVAMDQVLNGAGSVDNSGQGSGSGSGTGTGSGSGSASRSNTLTPAGTK